MFPVVADRMAAVNRLGGDTNELTHPHTPIACVCERVCFGVCFGPKCQGQTHVSCMTIFFRKENAPLVFKVVVAAVPISNSFACQN